MLYPAPSLQPIAAVRRGVRTAAFFERLGMIRDARARSRTASTPPFRPAQIGSGEPTLKRSN
jgi:hypothetical protein